MNYIFDYILENLPNLIVVIIYFIIFLPIIVINICTWIFIIILPFIASIIPLIPNKFINSIKINKNRDKLGKLSFSFGRNLTILQKYLTDEFPFKIIKRTTISSIQKRFLEMYITMYKTILGSIYSGMKKGREINKNDNVKWEDVNIYRKIINYPIFVISTFLFSLLLLMVSSILMLPTIVFIILIIDVI